MISRNMTWIRYPSHSSARIEDIIWSQNVISRFMHCYFAIFVPPGFLAGIVILAMFIRTCARRTPEKLDVLVLAHTTSGLFMILFSFTVTVRPNYLDVTYLECGALSFFFNLFYFTSQYLVVLMKLSFHLNRHPPRNAFIIKAHQNPTVCIGFVLTWAVCMALIVVALLGIENYHGRTDCQLDPLFAWPEYEIIKFTFGFGVPSVFQLFCFFLLLFKGARPQTHSPRRNVLSLSIVLVTALSMFACRLFYNVILLSRTALKIQRSVGTPQTELIMNIAEITLFAESCVSLVLVLCLHKPYRSGFFSFIRNATKVCRRRGADNRSHEMPEAQLFKDAYSTTGPCQDPEEGKRGYVGEEKGDLKGDKYTDLKNNTNLKDTLVKLTEPTLLSSYAIHSGFQTSDPHRFLSGYDSGAGSPSLHTPRPTKRTVTKSRGHRWPLLPKATPLESRGGFPKTASRNRQGAAHPSGEQVASWVRRLPGHRELEIQQKPTGEAAKRHVLLGGRVHHHVQTACDEKRILLLVGWELGVPWDYNSSPGDKDQFPSGENGCFWKWTLLVTLDGVAGEEKCQAFSGMGLKPVVTPGLVGGARLQCKWANPFNNTTPPA